MTRHGQARTARASVSSLRSSRDPLATYSQRPSAVPRWQDPAVPTTGSAFLEASMRSVSRRGAMFATIVVVTLMIGSAVGAVAASHQFGYHKIRSGLPAGLPKLSVTSTDLAAHRPIPQQFWGCTDPGVSPELSWSGAPASSATIERIAEA